MIHDLLFCLFEKTVPVSHIDLLHFSKFKLRLPKHLRSSFAAVLHKTENFMDSLLINKVLVEKKPASTVKKRKWLSWLSLLFYPVGIFRAWRSKKRVWLKLLYTIIGLPVFLLEGHAKSEFHNISSPVHIKKRENTIFNTITSSVAVIPLHHQLFMHSPSATIILFSKECYRVMIPAAWDDWPTVSMAGKHF